MKQCENAYCPVCKKKLELIAACGAAQYFCNHCKRLVSKKTVLEDVDIKEAQDKS